jgi:hypothetical protein
VNRHPHPAWHEPPLPGFEDPGDRVSVPVDDHLPEAPPGPPPVMNVMVVRSSRRKRTVAAELKGGVLHLYLPGWMDEHDEFEWVCRMTRHFEQKARSNLVDLGERAGTLARRYRLPPPASIRWVDMTTRWGSCTPGAGTVRISNRLASFPPWVLDYVIVHELAHLVESNHSPAFWKLVRRYPRAERARGYLMAKSGDDTDAD